MIKKIGRNLSSGGGEKSQLHEVNFLSFCKKFKNFLKLILSTNSPLHMFIQNKNTFMKISVLHKINITHRRSFQHKTLQYWSTDEELKLLRYQEIKIRNKC